MSNKIDTLKACVDATSIGVLVGALVDKLPTIAAAFTLLWTIIRILETDTVKTIFRWLRRKVRK